MGDKIEHLCDLIAIAIGGGYDCAFQKSEQCGGKVATEGHICPECYSQYGDGE